MYNILFTVLQTTVVYGRIKYIVRDRGWIIFYLLFSESSDALAVEFTFVTIILKLKLT